MKERKNERMKTDKCVWWIYGRCSKFTHTRLLRISRNPIVEFTCTMSWIEITKITNAIFLWARRRRWAWNENWFHFFSFTCSASYIFWSFAMKKKEAKKKPKSVKRNTYNSNSGECSDGGRKRSVQIKGTEGKWHKNDSMCLWWWCTSGKYTTNRDYFFLSKQ